MAGFSEITRFALCFVNMKNIRKCKINTGPIYADLVTFHGLEVGATVGGLTESGSQSPKINYLLRLLVLLSGQMERKLPSLCYEKFFF